MSLPTPPPEASVEPTVPEETSLPSPLFGGAEPSHPGLGLERPIRRRLQGKRIALCVTGSIAAYKSALLLRLLLKEGAEVEVILSRGASEFIGAATFAGLNGKAPFSDMFATPPGGELHVDLAARSDLVLVAP